MAACCTITAPAAAADFQFVAVSAVTKGVVVDAGLTGDLTQGSASNVGDLKRFPIDGEGFGHGATFYSQISAAASDARVLQQVMQRERERTHGALEAGKGQRRDWRRILPHRSRTDFGPAQLPHSLTPSAQFRTSFSADCCA